MNEWNVPTARGKHTIDGLIDMRNKVINMHVIDVTGLKVRDRIQDLRDYFSKKGIDIKRTAPGVIQIGEVHIHIISALDTYWEERTRGFKDFLVEN